MQSKVPFLDLRSHHEPHMPEFLSAIREVIESCAFAGGPYVSKFEEAFAAYCQTGHASGLGNGTDALWFALLALGVGPGDEVITVPSTFIATTEAISFCGAKPVFVDIDETTYTMDPSLLEAAITPRTKAIIPVHLFGQMADMDPILAIGRKHGIPVVEDSAQAHGASYNGQVAGSVGAVGCFSFYPGKNLGAFGEAGATTTNDPELQRKICVLRDHGQVRKYHHAMIGWNGRMDGIQAAVLSIKLRHLDKATDLRRQHAAQYRKELAGVEGVILPTEAPGRKHVYHVYAVRVGQRDRFIQSLTDYGIGTGIHYPVPVHLQECYASLGLREGSFPVAEKCAREFVSLPMFPELTPSQVTCVTEAVKRALSDGVR
jgi:dTDP-4-amino-4,6-dideoxygalactose transaminase